MRVCVAFLCVDGERGVIGCGGGVCGCRICCGVREKESVRDVNLIYPLYYI